MLFDAIEFNGEISCIDALYDFAFLLMDLWFRQLPARANAIFNRYLSVRDDLVGLWLAATAGTALARMPVSR